MNKKSQFRIIVTRDFLAEMNIIKYTKNEVFHEGFLQKSAGNSGFGHT